MWDQAFFYKLGMRCIEKETLGHAGILARNILDMTATTVPWPQVGEDGQRGVVRATNVGYSLLLPLVVIYSVMVILRRRTFGQPSGETVMLAQLVCVLLVAMFFFGEPRLRSTYDVFGLALLATCIADLFVQAEQKGDAAE